MASSAEAGLKTTGARTLSGQVDAATPQVPRDRAAMRRARADAREQRLKRLGFSDYEAYINSPLWSENP